MKVILRPDHPISRKQINDEALKVLYRLYHHGYTAYLVGGSVRDLLLGKKPKDFDVATNAHPHEINALFRNSRVIGRRFRLVQVFFKGGKIVEVSTFRSRSEYEEIEAGDGTILRTDSFGTPEEDAFRRDITINGLFYNIADFSIIDYVGGMEDLRLGMIRTIGNPDERFKQDPVRMIRVIRHSARTGFAIDEPTYQALSRHREELKKCSLSRIRDEFLRDLREGVAKSSLRLLIETGIIFSIFPDFVRVFGLHNPSSGGAQRFVLALFGLVDRLIKTGRTISDAVLLALFLTPYLVVVMPDHPYLGEKERSIYRMETIRFALDQILGPYSFPKVAREGALQILMAQSMLSKVLCRGFLPRRVRAKRYLHEAILYHAIEAEARGERIPALLRHAVPPDLVPWWPKESPKKQRAGQQ